jgi:hypothetical protein
METDHRWQKEKEATGIPRFPSSLNNTDKRTKEIDGKSSSRDIDQKRLQYPPFPSDASVALSTFVLPFQFIMTSIHRDFPS